MENCKIALSLPFTIQVSELHHGGKQFHLNEKKLINAKSCSDKGVGVKRRAPICDQVYMVVLMILVSTLLSGWPTLQTLYMEGEQFHRCNHHKKITKTLNHKRFSLGPSYQISRVYKWYWTMWVAMWLCVYVTMFVRHHFEDDHYFYS